ncbi:D-2-hydroxyacid dehydrogenase [Halorientalis pallida]|uniref:D-2-hydroxyacid dehydrogenase n=1 Tax=Halorientalis pallida TaxID=2479928 RepID=A0A498L6Z8_9EURY|nr:D-2-hydroxyacid dehydrogenase [Halorientalis pallida]RXK52072.1 D-2-hydroxyacid dehydrogenase [Halorientalis pallida]
MTDYADELTARLPDHTVRLARTPDAERDLVRHAPVVTGNDIDRDLLDRAEKLELFACTFAGTDHLPLDALADHGVTVTNASGIHAPGIAEQVLGYLLTFARRLHVSWERNRHGVCRHVQSTELKGSTVTVVGLGAVGTAVVDRLDGFDTETIGVRHSPAKGGPTDDVFGYDAIHEALARTDYLVLACPLTDVTRHLLDAEAFATLEPSSVVVNVARGPVVDTDALVAALRTSGIRGAALDVTDPEPLPTDHPLWGLDNALLTPHTAGHTPEHWPRLASILAGNVRTLLDDGDEMPLENVVQRD